MDTSASTKDRTVTGVTFRFYGRLAQFLSKKWGDAYVPYELNGIVVVKHAIEAQGIPHTEVDLILVNGESAGFYHRLSEGDFITVFPAFTSLDISTIQKLRPVLPYPPRFVIDNHLGQLARNLRLLGFDCLYNKDYADQDLAAIAFENDRVLLTRDRRLLMRKQIIYGFCLLTRDPAQQLRDVLHRYQLRPHIRPWRRCLRCNGLLGPVDKEAVIDRLEPKTKKYYHHFHICQDCEQIYWKGSHYPPLNQLVNEISQENERKPI
jgi:uncharacterized protein with PIN domain